MHICVCSKLPWASTHHSHTQGLTSEDSTLDTDTQNSRAATTSLILRLLLLQVSAEAFITFLLQAVLLKHHEPTEDATGNRPQQASSKYRGEREIKQNSTKRTNLLESVSEALPEWHSEDPRASCPGRRRHSLRRRSPSWSVHSLGPLLGPPFSK